MMMVMQWSVGLPEIRPFVWGRTGEKRSGERG
jgi:hypothetical protein